MTIQVTSIQGPDTEGAFLYLRAADPDYPHCTTVRTVALAALASGALTVAAERDALVADVEQKILNWNAAQAAIGEL
jgi:hypothetical protein